MDTKKVQLRAVRSDGQVFEYQNSDWGILTLEGIDFPAFEIFKVNRGSGNGVIITGKRKEARDIDITAHERNSSNNAIDRRTALGFHNSNYTYDLYITYMGVTRIAKDCQIQGAKCPSKNVYESLELTVSYLHPESDLLGENTDTTTFTDTIPMWHVTRAYTVGGSLTYGVISHATTKVINYLGSEDTFLKIVVEASGFIENLNITVNGIELNIKIELKGSDVLIVDSESKTITLNGKDVPLSKYNGEMLPKLILKYGDNTVKVAPDDEGNTAFNADVTYIGRYGGL